MEQRLRSKELIDSITCTKASLVKLYKSAFAELETGLRMHRDDPTRWHPEQCDFMMLDCCLSRLPTGNEAGIFYALDFGGTNVRALRIELPQHTVTQKNLQIADVPTREGYPEGLLDPRVPAKILFDVIAQHVKSLMKESGDLDRDPSSIREIGFTFSFGIVQPELTVALLGQWSKGFKTGLETDDPVIGRDVCKLLDEAFHRGNVPAKICCVLNDTLGTMIAAAMEKDRRSPPCTVGLIVGTGVNACYFDPDAESYNYKGNIINVEIGGFSKDLPTCIADAQVDFESSNRGHQLLEKLVSGFYLAESARIMLLHIFQHEAPPTLWEHSILKTECLARIYALDSSPAFKTAPAGAQDVNDDVLDAPDSGPETTTTVESSSHMGIVRNSHLKTAAAIASIMREELQWKCSPEQAVIIKTVVDAYFDRSAHLLAAVIAALCKKTRHLQRAMGGVTVGVDGSLYRKNPKYQKTIIAGLNDILGPNLASLIHFQQTSDGSGKGAACLAATLSH